MAKRAEGCRLLHLAKRTSSGGLISYAKPIAIVGVKNIKIGNEDYIMTFDMRSIAVFKELTGKSFLQSSAKLGLLDDEVVLGFLGATLRKVNEENKPLGKQVYYMDIIYLLLNLSQIVIELVTSSLPQSKSNEKNIKKK